MFVAILFRSTLKSFSNQTSFLSVCRYVDFGFAQDTASKIKGTEQYITNQLFHNGLRDDPKDVMKRLFQLSKREYC
jgi:hypothetical protein